jgi:hypothetical protein
MTFLQLRRIVMAQIKKTQKNYGPISRTTTAMDTKATSSVVTDEVRVGERGEVLGVGRGVWEQEEEEVEEARRTRTARSRSRRMNVPHGRRNGGSGS